MLIEAACMALVIWHEARFEPIEGQIAVGQVVMERVKDRRWPNTVCEVVFQPKQFTNVGKSIKRQKDWEEFLPLAELIIKDLVKDVVPDANHFYADYIDPPKWSKKMRVVKHIGHHIFLTDKADVAQLEEALICNQGVAGSSPAVGSMHIVTDPILMYGNPEVG